MRNRHRTDTSPGWIRRELAAIKAQMREMSAARRLESATIGKGGITISGGGSLDSRYANGTIGAELGPVGQSDINPIGDGFALNLFTENQSVVFQAARLPVSATHPAGYSSMYAAGVINLLSTGLLSQVYIDDTVVNLFSPGGVKIGHSTTGASANCFIDPSDGRIWRSTSSLRYKQDIEDATVDPADVLQMQGRTWRDKGEVERDPDTENRYVGFIAEELHDLGLGRFVVYDEEDRPDAIAYDRLAVALLEVVKDLNTRVEALEAS